MFSISIEELLKKGNLNKLYIGDTASNVEEFLGKPDMIGGGSRKYPWPNIWKYGDVELGFDPRERILRYISINFWGSNIYKPSGGKHIKLESLGIFGGMKAADFEQIMRVNEIACVDVEPINSGTREFKVGERALVTFSEDAIVFGDWIGLMKIIIE